MSYGTYRRYRHCEHCGERLRMQPNGEGKWVQCITVEWKNSADCERNEDGHEPRS